MADEKPKTEEKQAPKAEKPVKKEAPKKEEKFPEIKPGYTIRIYQKIKEGDKERTQYFEGIILAMQGKTPASKTITVRKISEGVAVEKIFPLGSPTIEKIVVQKKANTRKSKLYYLRDYKKRLKEEKVG
ncbi:MAG: 50S ribosomal protein L19 [Patescibacteria group bacterium]|nr:50S ribosomal protein L19 [Patescibacteria group bacterium]